MQLLRHKYSLKILLEIAGLSRATFYYHLRALNGVDKDQELKDRIKRIFERNSHHYGYRRIQIELRRSYDMVVNHKKVQRLMSELGLKAKTPRKKYNSYRDGVTNHKVDNLLDQNFKVDKAKTKLVTDVTEMKVRDGKKLYLSPVMDLFNNEILSFNIYTSQTLGLVTNMFKRQFKKTMKLCAGAILHSDQGWHYKHNEYARLLKDLDLTPSMSRKGNCYDNAAMESFFGTLKRELYNERKWGSVEELKVAIRKYIKFYNQQRIVLRLKASPVEFRLRTAGQLSV